jgi:hypothetical protein
MKQHSEALADFSKAVENLGGKNAINYKPLHLMAQVYVNPPAYLSAFSDI